LLKKEKFQDIRGSVKVTKALEWHFGKVIHYYLF